MGGTGNLPSRLSDWVDGNSTRVNSKLIRVAAESFGYEQAGPLIGSHQLGSTHRGLWGAKRDKRQLTFN